MGEKTILAPCLFSRRGKNSSSKGFFGSLARKYSASRGSSFSCWMSEIIAVTDSIFESDLNSSLENREIPSW
jgi:hypothetical protein